MRFIHCDLDSKESSTNVSETERMKNLQIALIFLSLLTFFFFLAICASCNQIGHSRKRSRLCPLNPMNIIVSDGSESVPNAVCMCCLEEDHHSRTNKRCRLHSSSIDLSSTNTGHISAPNANPALETADPDFVPADSPLATTDRPLATIDPALPTNEPALPTSESAALPNNEPITSTEEEVSAFFEPVSSSLSTTAANDGVCTECLSSVHPIDECPVLFFTRNPRLAAHNVGRDYSISQQILRYDAGRMKVECRSCKALMWIDERSNKAFSNPIFHICCGKGKYVLHPFPKTPPLLSGLLKGNTPQCKEFRSHIRTYNNALSFTSLGVNLDETVANRINGAY
jgi:hypothetical protein